MRERQRFEAARREALRYRELGYNPLPSRMDRKGPMLPTYAGYWDTPLPDATFADWATTNIQLMCGVRWRLCVVDCDGEEAHTVWRRMKAYNRQARGALPTWVARTGGGGWHYYFALPAGLPECPSRRLWGRWDTWAGTAWRKPGTAMKGDWMRHEEIRLLGDRSLVIAPPSRHVKTGLAYEFLPGRGPFDYRRPMEAPAWLLAIPAVVNLITRVPRPEPRIHRPQGPSSGPTGVSHHRDRVLEAIPEKDTLAASCGLRFASDRVNANGWRYCFAIDREDNTPSAGFQVERGIYKDMRDGTVLSLFDLAVELGAYPDWRAACNDLGERYGPAADRPRARAN
jgi:hypothetical protein